MILIKTEEEIALLEASNELVSKTLAEVARAIGPGVTTLSLDRIAETLGLSDEQREKFGPAYEEFTKKQKALRDQTRSGELDREEARERQKELRKERDAKLKEILTEEQYKKFQQHTKR